jgi:hypothetical protein
MGVTGKVRWTKLPIERIIQQIEAVEIETLSSLKEPIRAVIERNVGTQYYSLAALKNMGHPYRIGGPGRPGGLPAGVVNMQSGGFFASFRIRGPLVASGNRITISVYNTAGYKVLGGYLAEGTERMKGRPWATHLETEIFKVTSPVIAALQKRLKLKVIV